MFDRGYVEYHADRFQDASILVEDDGRPVAALPASRSGGAVASHGGLTFGGLSHGPEIGARRAIELLDTLLAFLGAEGVETLRYKAVPHIYHRFPAEGDLYALSRRGAVLDRREVSASIVLARPVAPGKGRRAGIGRARRAGLDVGRDDDLEGFMALEDAVLRERHGVRPVHTAPELAMLRSRFPESIDLWTARRSGAILAGMVAYVTPMVAHAQYLAASPAGRDASALDGVIAAALAHYRGRVEVFDFGISTTAAGSVLNEGLARNKESYGARPICYDSYEVPVPPRSRVAI